MSALLKPRPLAAEADSSVGSMPKLIVVAVVGHCPWGVGGGRAEMSSSSGSCWLSGTSSHYNPPPPPPPPRVPPLHEQTEGMMTDEEG